MAKLFVFLACLFLALSLPLVSAGWLSNAEDFVEAPEKFASKLVGQLLDGVVGPSVDHAADALRQAVSNLEETFIKPAVNDLVTGVQKIQDHGAAVLKDAVNEVLNKFFDDMQVTIKEGYIYAQQFEEQTVEDIRDKIIDKFFDRLEKLREKAEHDAIILLNRFEAEAKEMSCLAQGFITRVEEGFRKLDLAPANPNDTCRVEIDQKFPGRNLLLKPSRVFSERELYEYKKCQIFANVDGKTPMKSVLMAYADWQDLAADMRCLASSRGADENERYYFSELSAAGREIRAFHSLEQSSKRAHRSVRSLISMTPTPQTKSLKDTLNCSEGSDLQACIEKSIETCEDAKATCEKVDNEYTAINSSLSEVSNMMKSMVMPPELISSAPLVWISYATKCMINYSLGSYVVWVPADSNNLIPTCDAVCPTRVSSVGCAGKTANCQFATHVWKQGKYYSYPGGCSMTSAAESMGVICCCQIPGPEGCVTLPVAP